MLKEKYFSLSSFSPVKISPLKVIFIYSVVIQTSKRVKDHLIHSMMVEFCCCAVVMDVSILSILPSERNQSLGGHGQRGYLQISIKRVINIGQYLPTPSSRP